MKTYSVRTISDNYQEVYKVTADDFSYENTEHGFRYVFFSGEDERKLVAMFVVSPRHTIQITEVDGLPVC